MLKSPRGMINIQRLDAPGSAGFEYILHNSAKCFLALLKGTFPPKYSYPVQTQRVISKTAPDKRRGNSKHGAEDKPMINSPTVQGQAHRAGRRV